MQSLRAFTSSPSKPNHEKSVVTSLLAAPEQLTSLIAVPIYEKSPASVGIDSWDGYVEFIPPDATLPYTKIVGLWTLFDHFGEDTLQLCGFLPKSQLCVDLAELIVHGIYKAKKGRLR